MIKREDAIFGENFHTALRKGSDTDWSALLWNLIILTINVDADMAKRDRAWSHFMKFAQPLWLQGKSCQQIAKSYCIAYRDYSEEHAPWPKGSHFHSFAIALRMCDQETWDEIDTTVKCWLEEE